MNKTYRFILTVLLSISLVSCASGPKCESTGQYLDSTVITAKVKTKLVNSLGFKAAHSISIKTYKDTVQLSGFVKSKKIKKQAAKVVQKVSGIKHVINSLTVKI